MDRVTKLFFVLLVVNKLLYWLHAPSCNTLIYNLFCDFSYQIWWLVDNRPKLHQIWILKTLSSRSNGSATPLFVVFMWSQPTHELVFLVMIRQTTQYWFIFNSIFLPQTSKIVRAATTVRWYLIQVWTAALPHPVSVLVTLVTSQHFR